MSRNQPTHLSESMGAEVLIRVDESIQVGRGHMARCLALGSALRAAGASVSFCCIDIHSETKRWIQDHDMDLTSVGNDGDFLQQDLSGRIVIVDGYQFTSQFWDRLLVSGADKTVAIDDHRQFYHRADIVICYNEGLAPDQLSRSSHSCLFLGGRYILLRPSIRKAALHAHRPTTRRALLLACGGTRQDAWVAQSLPKLAKLDAEAPLWVLSGRKLSQKKVLARSGLSAKRVRFFSGLDALKMVNLYRRAQILLTPGSTLMLEAFAAGCPTMAGWLAENQRNSLRFYDDQGLIVNLGKLNPIADDVLVRAHRRLRRHAGPMIYRQRAYISSADGGVDTLVQAIMKPTARCKTSLASPEAAATILELTQAKYQ